MLVFVTYLITLTCSCSLQLFPVSCNLFQKLIAGNLQTNCCNLLLNSAFCLALYLIVVHFRGELQHVDDVSEQKAKCRPIKTREIGGATLSDVLYVNLSLAYIIQSNFFLKLVLVIVPKSKLLQRYFSMNFLPIFLRKVFLKTLIDCFYTSSSELL